ncbi:erythromycin esterase family protein [Amycolatopsis rhabdoformis]|uniref:Erythromycin esterase family protein n=1 Tax=Amycolatopsis rhabdoformis TaxID=1448059 RepID=A0ABZ1HZW7_9PSEU|nr:erythromycin esterase family protein [Amycolatopsis rhabdoformis]WSE26944.1 erythromycin esterase family protein [Amycolatopsis rhabdoformis]
MSTSTTPRGIGRELDDAAALGRAVDELPAPALLALGEPTHGIAAFPLLRNELLTVLVERGYRSIALETDVFAASVVDDYVTGGAGDLDEVLKTGFSHWFGNVPGNRELVQWLREHNAGRAPEDQVRFHGFDAPTETTSAPSPRRSLTTVLEFLPAALRPPIPDLDALLGEDGDWTNEAAMYDAAASIGGSDRAHALRIVADDLVSALRRAAPMRQPADPAGYRLAAAHARTAVGLLRYHAAMAFASPERFGTLLGLRAEMMADNLLAMVEQERHRGPSLVFAHNVHLQRAVSTMQMGPEEATWGSAGALVALTLGERYVFVATDANPHSEPGTLQGELAAATTRRAFFPAPALRAALPASTGAGEPILPGHLPLTPAQLGGADAVIFVADTDGQRVDYWLA